MCLDYYYVEILSTGGPYLAGDHSHQVNTPQSEPLTILLRTYLLLNSQNIQQDGAQAQVRDCSALFQ